MVTVKLDDSETYKATKTGGKMVGGSGVNMKALQVPSTILNLVYLPLLSIVSVYQLVHIFLSLGIEPTPRFHTYHY